MRFGPVFSVWAALLVAVTGGVVICLRWIDQPLALMFLANSGLFSGLGTGLGSVVLVAGEMAVITILAFVRMAKGDLPSFAKAVFVACCASLSAFVANDYVFKFVFGRLKPSEFFQSHTNQIFFFFQGSQQSSFPSGHMVMATAFAMAMMRLQPRTRPALVFLLCLGAVALLVGDWHFLSDVIAGTFVGGTAGFVAGELWSEHLRKHG
jgi:membrane-associated phospholipid phosphatase